MTLKPTIANAELLRTQMQLLAEASERAYLFSIFVVAVIAYSLWPDVPTAHVLTWAVVSITITLSRYFHFRQFRMMDDDSAMLTFQHWFTIGTLSSAVAWGGLGTFIFVLDDALKQALIAVVALGISAGSIIVLSSLVTVARVSVSITLLPVITAFAVLGGEYIAFAFVITAFCVYLNYLAISINASITKSYVAEIENKQLIQQLQDSKNSVEAMNRQLKTEIGVRNEAESQMVVARDNAEKAARVKSDFLATMSHEIRTPMNGVLGMTELLMNTDLSAKQFRFADTIRRSGEALLAIINDILDFSKIDAGKLEIQHTVFDLRQLVEDTGSFFADTAQSKRIELVTDFPPTEHAAYRGDPDRIRQILLNLVGNALKFTERGEVSVHVKTEQSAKDESVIKFAVKDSGIGIPEEHQSHIFESFQQADASTTRKFGGTGLGLAICNRLVNLMRGEIGVESVAGKGATFWFTVTLTPVAESTISSNVKNDLNLEGLRALIVDNNQTNRDVLGHQLANWGMSTTAVADGNQALKDLNLAIDTKRLYDVIIVDRQLPDMNGVELAQRISTNKNTKSIAIVMLSSINQLEETGQWYRAGVDVYVNKPIRQAELYEALGIALEEKNKIDNLSTESNDENTTAEQNTFNARILVAEDNPINQELVLTMLETMGCTVLVVDNGVKAVEAITQAPLDQLRGGYDMVLMDCQMPELDGYQATGEIRAWEKSEQDTAGSAAIPIIALTANAMAGDRERCIASGMDDYLTKPFTQEALAAICQKWLSLEKMVKQDIQDAKQLKQEQVKQASAISATSLDQAALDNIRKLQRDGGPDILAKIVNLYLKNAPPMLEKLQEAVATGNAELLRGTAHSFKSSSANLGASKLSELCRDLENMGREKNLEQALATLGILEFEFESVCNALQSEIAAEAA